VISAPAAAAAAAAAAKEKIRKNTPSRWKTSRKINLFEKPEESLEAKGSQLSSQKGTDREFYLRSIITDNHIILFSSMVIIE